MIFLHVFFENENFFYFNLKGTLALVFYLFALWVYFLGNFFFVSAPNHNLPANCKCQSFLNVCERANELMVVQLHGPIAGKRNERETKTKINEMKIKKERNVHLILRETSLGYVCRKRAA